MENTLTEIIDRLNGLKEDALFDVKQSWFEDGLHENMIQINQLQTAISLLKGLKDSGAQSIVNNIKI